MCKVPRKRRTVAIDNPDHVGEGTDSLIGAKGKDGVAGGSRHHIAHRTEGEVIARVGRCGQHSHAEPGRIAHADQVGLAIGVSDVDGLKRDCICEKRSACVVVDVLGDAHRTRTHGRAGSGQIGRVSIDHTQSVAVGTRPLTCCKTQ